MLVRDSLRALALAGTSIAVTIGLGSHPGVTQTNDILFQKNGWTGSTLTSGGRVTGCITKTAVSGSMSFALAQFDDRKWVAGFAKTGGFTANMRWDMELLVDDKSIHTGTAVVGSNGLAILTPPLSSGAVSALSRGHTLQVVTVLGHFEYSLAGSADAIEFAAKCASEISSGAASDDPAGDFPIAPTHQQQYPKALPSGWGVVELLPRKSNSPAVCVARKSVTPRVIFGLIPMGGDLWEATMGRSGGFGDPAKPGTSQPIQLAVRGRRIYSGEIYFGPSKEFAHLEPLMSEAVVRLLMQANTLEFISKDRTYYYDVSGIREALVEAQRCRNPGVNSARPPRDEPRDAAADTITGTGFFVSSDGHVLTNAHVVKGCASAEVSQPGTKSAVAQIVATDASNDLALLTSDLKPNNVPYLRTVPRTGESVATYGFPYKGILPSTGNFTIGNVTATAGLDDDTRMLQVSVPLQAGNSGGPLVDQSGNVVGVVVAKLNAAKVLRERGDLPQNVNFAIKASIARTFLESNGILGGAEQSATTKLAPEDLSETARKFTVFIACKR